MRFTQPDRYVDDNSLGGLALCLPEFVDRVEHGRLWLATIGISDYDPHSRIPINPDITPRIISYTGISGYCVKILMDEIPIASR